MANVRVELKETIFDKNIKDDSPKSPTVLPWDRFANWLHCICIVTFDLELGQAMEMIYPGHIRLTEKEKTSVCYLSFPDSNSGCMGDTQFHFRIRQCPGRRPVIPAHIHYNQHSPVATQIDGAHFFGYVYFRQVKDRSLRRGYFQKSVVLLTRLPFINLFTHLVGMIAPEFFENGEPSIEAACHDIDQWPFPEPGQTINLPIMGTVLQSILPAPHIISSVHEVDIFRCFHPVLSHIHLLWELVLTGEPIVVMASSPTVCSELVQGLVSIAWPLKYCSDYRPFFTIHDSEFKEYTTRTQAPPPIILGVTNPFFAKTLQHWPHIIRIGDLSHSNSSPSKHSQKLKKGTNLKTLDSKPGVYTRYKPFLNKDKLILKRLAKGVQTKRPLEVQNAMLRRHLLELTQSFMIPLERYMASLMPLQRNISPYKGTPKLRPFDTNEFLRTLEFSGPQLTTGTKGDWIGLYKRFFKSFNFEGWYNNRQNDVNKKLEVLHLEAMSDADLTLWIQDKQEVEIVDLVLRLRDKLMTASTSQLPVRQEVMQKLQVHMDGIINSLPEDLRTVLRTN